MACFDMMPFKKRKETTHLFKGCSWFFLLFFFSFLLGGHVIFVAVAIWPQKGNFFLSQVLGTPAGLGMEYCGTTCTFSIQAGCAHNPLPVPVGFSPLYSLGVHISEEESDVLLHPQLSLRKGGQG